MFLDENGFNLLYVQVDILHYVRAVYRASTHHEKNAQLMAILSSTKAKILLI